MKNKKQQRPHGPPVRVRGPTIRRHRGGSKYSSQDSLAIDKRIRGCEKTMYRAEKCENIRRSTVESLAEIFGCEYEDLLCKHEGRPLPDECDEKRCPLVNKLSESDNVEQDEPETNHVEETTGGPKKTPVKKVEKQLGEEVEEIPTPRGNSGTNDISHQKMKMQGNGNQNPEMNDNEKDRSQPKPGAQENVGRSKFESTVTGNNAHVYQNSVIVRIGSIRLYLIAIVLLVILATIFYFVFLNPYLQSIRSEGTKQKSEKPEIREVLTNCEHNPSMVPFQDSKATHLLIADFWGSNPRDKNFGREVAELVNAAMLDLHTREYNNKEKPKIKAPREFLNVRMLKCAINSHHQAETIARNLNADLVLWGRAFKKELGHCKKEGCDYTIKASATLNHQAIELQKTSKRLQFFGLEEIDLPALMATQPYQLVYLALAIHFFEQENYPFAKRFFEKTQKRLLTGSEYTWYLDLSLGIAQFQLGKFDESLSNAKRALRVTKGKNLKAEAIARNLIGSIHSEVGQYKRALSYFKAAREICVREFRQNHPCVVSSLSGMGLVYMARGELIRSMEYYMMSLEILRKTVGDEHPDIARILNNLSDAMAMQGDFEQAIKHKKEALVIIRKTLGKWHPEMARILLRYGSVLLLQTRLKEAGKCFLNALAILRKTVGDDHPNTAEAYFSIGRIKAMNGFHEKALTEYTKAMDRLENSIGHNNLHIAKITFFMGDAWYDLGRNGKALDNWESGLGIIMRMFGELKHPMAAMFFMGIGKILRDEEQYEKALKYHYAARGIIERKFGKDHLDISIVLNEIGNVLYKQGKLQQALSYMERALKIALNSGNGEHGGIAGFYGDIGDVYSSMREYKQALVQHEKALKVAQRNWGDDNYRVAEIHDDIGVILGKIGQFGKAMNSHKMAVTIFEALYGKDTETIITPIVNMASLFEIQGQHQRFAEFLKIAKERRQKARQNGRPIKHKTVEELKRLQMVYDKIKLEN